MFCITLSQLLEVSATAARESNSPEKFAIFSGKLWRKALLKRAIRVHGSRISVKR